MSIDKWYIKYFLMFLFLLISLVVLEHVFIYFTPFIIAAVIASLINPVVDYLDKRIPIHRGFVVFIVLILVIVILVTMIIIGGAQGYLELNRLLKNLPDYRSIDSQIKWFSEQNQQLQNFMENWEISDPVKDAINGNLQLLYNGIRDALVSVINSILDFLTKLPRMLMILFIAFIAAFFISRDRDKIKEFLINIFPDDIQPKIANVFTQLNRSAVGYIRAMLILITISGLVAGIGVKLMGNQYALVVGAAAAILDLIPIIGPALLFYPWIAVALIFGNFSQAFSLFLLHLFLAGVRSASEGKIMGKNLGLHPLATMTALFSGYRILGAIGFVVGPTFLVIIKAIVDSDLIDIKK
ncbi:MAG: sporulation integral membrane protein YtvI [Halanaerobium sp. 4-GBenrich]|jgi:sporulation integral membrane protein YtvI|uniref:Sporulation integral membrane protein YtvI n=1 Tax=Halanaerobium congolense TaxID=54121 RepID=A0A4R8GW16_9FIRM|nr:sporulation integral membrane protein YtvI [Halanaerobium congolense]KXS50289.1 MAG: sporulation integral membrane protein YtvI [Halanaerobium sp. T82-1]ODS50454.1 MAG: sporulation integral membrane protein YtvI [Halanaerobium sp. 4-GBenrich]OEG62392.1 MAG: sporulation integral membrane protein YtvI [Halanaerobium sp. MDAL1]TDX46911.1 sporulation integral membrane protein YtvI [Halanaerobium congolense]SDK37331.1 sporulation integral membrane protein YtvI [Halanaerobium congolense]